MKMKVGILIGRFQVPGGPHEGHRMLIRSILESVDKLIILVGSSNQCRSPKNPYTFSERSNWLQQYVKGLNKLNNLVVLPINDYRYNDSQWMTDVCNTITHTLDEIRGYEPLDNNVTLFGHFKNGNDYLKWFPQFNFCNIDTEVEVSGTEMRRQLRNLLPESVQQDLKYYEEEEARFRDYPYPEALNINCGDAVLECLGHVLLIKRKNYPGKDLWALPGGHKNKNETFLQCAIRELIEETNVRVPKKVLLGSIRSSRLFDDPNRSYGITRSTLGVHMVVDPNPDGSLPRANGRDDAVEARWFPLQTILNELELFDDHKDIIIELTGVMPIPAYRNPNIK